MEDLTALLTVLETGSILRAAERLGVSRATVRRRLERLEERVGGAVLARDGQSVVPTARGEILVRQGRRLRLETEALYRAARHVDERAPPTVSVAIPPGLPPEILLAALGLLRASDAPPQLTLHVAADPVAVLLDGADLAVHVGSLPPEGPFRASVVTRVTEQLMVSPTYPRPPQSLEELSHHPLLLCGDEPALPLLDGGLLPVEPVLLCLDAHLVRLAVRAGLGIGLVPDRGPAEGDDLQPVLSEQIGRRRKLWLVYPEALADSGAIRSVRSLLPQLVEAGVGA